MKNLLKNDYVVLVSIAAILIVAFVFFSLVGDKQSTKELKVNDIYNFKDGDLVKVKLQDEVFEVGIAESRTRKAKGLSVRESLGEKEGLLFVFEEYKKHPFWMKGMSFSLDIVWIKDDKVVDIEKNLSAELQDTKSFRPSKKSNFVLELPAGTTDEIKLEVGDTVNFLEEIEGQFNFGDGQM